MGNPVIFNGLNAKMLPQGGLLRQDGSLLKYDGDINYISNGHAQVSAAGWTVYNDGAAPVPIDGTGGVATVTFARSLVAPLHGVASFLFTHNAANEQGQGFSYDFSIDNGDVSKNFVLSLDVKASVNFISGVASDVRFFIYDITNTTLITPTVNNINSSSGEIDVFFTATASTSYRLIGHIATVNAAAWTLQFGKVFVGSVTNVLGPSAAQVVVFTDEKPLGTNGGSATPGSWQTRTLNTTYNPLLVPWASLAANQFTLTAGTYSINCSSPFQKTDRSSIKIRNITDGADTVVGSSDFSFAAQNASTRCEISGVFTIAATKTFELQYWVDTNSTATDLGVAVGHGTNEVYSIVSVQQLLNPILISGPQIVAINETQPSGTNGGTFTSGAWQTRTLNTLINPLSYTWVSLAANQFTLQPGTYAITGGAPGFFVDRHKVKLRNITDATDQSIGTSEQTTGNAVNTYSKFHDVFTIVAAKTFEVQHQCQTTSPGTGFGSQDGFGVNEVYTAVMIEKIA